MTIDCLSLGLGIVLGFVIAIVIGTIWRRKKSHLWEMRKLIKEASKEIHSGYEKIQALYQVVELADMKGRVEK